MGDPSEKGLNAAEKAHRRKRRRAAIRHAFLTRAPNRLTGRRFSRVRPGRNFRRNHRVVELPGLPDELCGLRITHLSDPHVGELVTPDHLPHIVDAANELAGDMVAVTGDFIDFSNSFLPPVMEAMAQLQAPLGVYFVLGNHDYLDDAEEVKRAFGQADLALLLNQAVRLRHRDRVLAVGGIDWSAAQRTQARTVRDTWKKMSPCDLSVLLAHHPHAFDPAHRCGIDLTLSGHTHGGQMLVSNKRSRKGSIGLANLGFRYTRGLYERGDSRLFVSSGVGSWFPIRFRCPAEITSLELQATY